MFEKQKNKISSATTITTNSLSDTKTTIIGYDDNGKLVSLNEHALKGPARSFLFGYPKCGKSQAFLVPYLAQAVRRGETCLIGSDGDLYNATADYFRSAGYRVRHLNFCDLNKSDTCNIMYYIKHANDIYDLKHRAELFSTTLIATAIGEHYSNAVIDALSSLLVAVTMRVVLDADMPSTLGEIAYVLSQGGAYIDSLLDSKRTEGSARAALPVYDRFLKQVRTCSSFDLNLLVWLLHRADMDDLKHVIDESDSVDGLAQLGQPHQVTFVSAPMNNPTLRGYAAVYLAMCMDQERQGKRGGTANANIILDNAGDMGYYAGLPDFFTAQNEPETLERGYTSAVFTFRNKAQVDHLYETEAQAMFDTANLLVGCGINDSDTAALFLGNAGKAGKKGLLGWQAKSGELQERDLYSAGTSHTFAVVSKQPAISCWQFGNKQLQNL